MNQRNSGFRNHVFVVTGSTQGIGESIALALASEGAAGLVVCGRNESNGARVKASVEDFGAAA
jgi:NAD(P)-dependent dehydrogenase (short-subunit alcohol dehydrogenase family)